MAKRVQAGKTYIYSGKGLFESLFADLRDGDVVQVVNVHGGRNSGYLRHVMRQDGHVTLCNIHFLTPYAH